MAHITIYIEENMEATTWMDSLEIKDDPSATNLITFMGAAPNFLYSDDDNTTYSEVTVNVENGEGYPAENVPVTFTTNLGNITSTINTDSNGQAINMFYDNGVAGLADITATIPGGSSASKTIAIIDHPDTESSITSINASPTEIFADGDNTTYSTISATVEDSDGYPADGIAVSFQTTLGYIVSVVNTDTDGMAIVNFYDNGAVGTATITAQIVGNAATAVTTSVDVVLDPDEQSAITSIFASPTELYADNDNSTYSEISVSVENLDGYPAENIAVAFGSDMGYLPSVTNTDTDGIAKVNFYDEGIVGTATITAYLVNDPTQTISTTVEIQTNPFVKFTKIQATPTTIYLDNGLTYSEIEVQVRDQSDFPVSGQQVNFRTNLGNIISAVTTDTTGVATTTLWDDNETGEALIEAFVGDVDTTITVTIAPLPPVTDFELNIGYPTIQVASIRTLSAVIDNAIGYIPDGTEITFETTVGYFQLSDVDDTYMGNRVVATTSNGLARAFFNSGQQIGSGTITAEYDDGTRIVVSEDITVTAGFPTTMDLTIHELEDPTSPLVQEILLDSPQDVYVMAHVKDSYGNSVGSNKNVIFDTDIGNIEFNAQTDENGNAFATFSAGIQAGVAHITADCDSASASTALTILSTEVNSIQFAIQQQISIDVQGTGGTESAELVVNLFDGNGNPIDESVNVWFKFSARPEGTTQGGSNINLEVDNMADSTSVQSSNGVAVVSVNSGFEAGIIGIETWCRNQQHQKISATKSNIIVQAGRPASCEFTIAGNDNGDELGAGIWRTQISALITDQWGNPVGDGTAAYFYLTESDHLGSVPDYAYVEAEDAFVGNENANGDSLPGTAFSYLSYDGTYTNETVNVAVDVGENITFEGSLVLPLQFGEISMVCTPMHINLGSSGNPDPTEADVTCHITLLDGQQNRVSGQRLVFTSSLGEPTDNDIHPVPADITDPDVLQDFSWSDDINEESPEIEWDGYTGWYQDELGRLDKNVTFFFWECPPPSMNGAGQTNGTIYVNIFGTDTSVSVTVTLFRYND